MNFEDIIWAIIIFFIMVWLILCTVFIHADIAKHEENETMLEKYRIEMQYRGEE